ncbi:anti-sigma factor domain-containing protein [Bacillus salipaludis]|uniref:Anti-sigma factor domain-containing protein n=1 Tax=Bacillus salipaludis TaxID=2547811 RepID=A0A4R5VZM4_9BACI|nr:anti-sigma factor domain-containing protein [Bacillus salipaludis]MDQ6596732.1 anti-sigma factor domain-containing protein [Bacillus salipaludis]TDK65048.1 anti-sigma factor domain-containing protein [Bacillus salipaludis]
MKKGIVMEIDDAFLLLLTPEGEFLRARKRNQPYEIGEEIHFFPIENNDLPASQSRRSVKNLFKLKPVWVGLMVLLLILASFIPAYQDNKAYAYMSIDVNPSIELGVNKKMQVVELTGFNEAGKEIIAHIPNWQKKDVSDLTQNLLSEMKKEGYLIDRKQVIISTVRTEQAEKPVEDELKENIEEIKESVNKQNLEATVLSGSEKERKEARQLGLTTGKYKENKIQSLQGADQTETKWINGKSKSQNAVPAPTAQPALPPGQQKKLDGDKNKSNNVTVKKGKQMNQPPSNRPQGKMKNKSEKKSKKQEKKDHSSKDSKPGHKNNSNQKKNSSHKNQNNKENISNQKNQNNKENISNHNKQLSNKNKSSHKGNSNQKAKGKEKHPQSSKTKNSQESYRYKHKN